MIFALSLNFLQYYTESQEYKSEVLSISVNCSQIQAVLQLELVIAGAPAGS